MMSSINGQCECFGAKLDRKARRVTLIINLVISIVPLIIVIGVFLSASLFAALIVMADCAVVPIAVVIILGRFAPKSYCVGCDGITICRKSGNIVIPLSSIESVRQCSYDDVWKDAAKVSAGSYRGYWGVFSSYVMNGEFLAYVTNTESIILIARKNDKPVIISPDQPQKFINLIMQYIK